VNKHKRRQILSKTGGHCAYCGDDLTYWKDIAWHVEHMIPKSRGGSNKLSNLVASCHQCNFSKHTKTPAEFKKYLKQRLFDALLDLAPLANSIYTSVVVPTGTPDPDPPENPGIELAIWNLVDIAKDSNILFYYEVLDLDRTDGI